MPQPRVLDDGRPVIWEPSPRQSEFLEASDDEVLYGGAAGGGKTDGMLIDALGASYQGHLNPRKKSIIFRRTYPELKAIIARSQEIYPAVMPGATYNKVEHTWTMPAGGTMRFGHLQNDDARFLYRSDAFDFIGFEELTLWATDVCWRYLASRNRSADPTLPCFMRANTNPDGPGQKWVMEYWGIDEMGGPTLLTREVEDERELPDGTFEEYTKTKRVRFIPAGPVLPAGRGGAACARLARTGR